MVGVSTFSGYSSNESSMLSLAIVDSRAERAGHRGHARLGRGGRRLGEAGRRAPRADRDPRDRLAGSLRRGRSRLVPAEVGRAWARTSSCSASTGPSPGRSRCTSGGSGASSTGPTAAPRRARSASAGSGIWHADLQHVLETRTPAGDEAGLRRQRAALPRARVPHGLVPRRGRRAPAGVRQDPRAALRRRGRARRRTTSRSATSRASPAELPQLTERFGELCARCRRAHRREDRLRVHAVRRRTSSSLDSRARGRRRRRRGERRHRDRHLAHVEARDRARRPAPHPARVPVVGRAERRPARRHGRPRRRDREPPQRCRARASSTCAATSRSAATTATRARGASRCSPRSCATTRST